MFSELHITSRSVKVRSTLFTVKENFRWDRTSEGGVNFLRLNFHYDNCKQSIWFPLYGNEMWLGILGLLSNTVSRVTFSFLSVFLHKVSTHYLCHLHVHPIYYVYQLFGIFSSHFIFVANFFYFFPSAYHNCSYIFIPWCWK